MKCGKSVLGILIRIIILLALVLSTCLQTHLPAAQAGYDAAYGWVYNHNLGINTNNPAYFDLELDSLGHPHLAYYDDITNNLIYRYFDGTQWQTGLTQWGTFNYISLELDTGDLPHIAFYSTISTMAGYAHYDGTTWQSLPITPVQTSAGQFVTLSLTDGGVPVVAFNYSGQTNLSIATLVAGAFVISEVENVLTSGDYYSHISLQLDQSDHPHLAYCMGTAVGSCDELRYAAFDGKDWTAEPLDRDPGAGYYASLVLDSSDYPHISYHIDNTSLNYMYQDAGGWHTSETVAAGDTGLYSSLALDSAGFPGIAFYQQQAPSMLRYLYWNGASWTANMSPELSNSGTYLNLELDSAGNPYLAFWDATYVDLALATYRPLPDLAITQTWVDTTDNRLLAVVRNVGQGTYSADLEVELYVNGGNIDYWGGSPTLLPGEQVIVDLPVPTCAAVSMEISIELVIYDSETNDANNTLVETWICDTQPVNISNFTISNITTTGFTAGWTTNKPTTTRLLYRRSNGRSAETYTDQTFTTTHQAVITGLTPATVYYAQAASEDAGGLVGTSKERTVKTAASAGSPPPTPLVNIERRNVRQESYQITASYLDISNIQHVDFFMDGKLIGTDYSADGGTFQLELSPGERGYDRTSFFSTDHEIIAQAVTLTGQPYANPVLFQPVQENIPIESHLVTPASESTLTILTPSVPPGTSLPFQVFAQQFDWQCDWGGGEVECADVAQPVAFVMFYLNGLAVGTDTTATSGVYSYNINLSNSPKGDYQLKAEVYATDGGVQEHRAVLHIVQGQPDLSFQRTVTRMGHYFKVDVTITNAAEATAPVVVTAYKDNFRGFQPARQQFPGWTVTPSSILQGKQTTANITFTTNPLLDPGESTSFSYNIVPVLFPDMSSAIYQVGSPASRIDYTLGGVAKIKSISAETVLVNDSASAGTASLGSARSRALSSADYILITTPSKLTDLYNIQDVHDLMGDMAHLAILKQGVLAFWDPSLEKSKLNNLLEDNSAWSDRLHPNFEKRGKGYVLLVGESEIIPAYTTGPFTLHWGDEDDSDDYDVRLSDNPYAHTDGNGAPDLLLGRIIGNTAAELSAALRSSIETHTNQSYEREQAYVGSGVGINEDEMQFAADRVTTTLEADGYTVSKHHWELEAFLETFTGINFAQHDGLTHADINGDGTEELIWARDDTNQVYFIDGTTGAFSFAFNLDFEDGDSLTAGDVDNDGQTEIIIGDRNDTIRTLETIGAVSSVFTRDFSAWEKVEAGNVSTAPQHPGDEIVMADDNDWIRVFTHSGISVTTVNIGTLGYDFADYDILRVGQVFPDAPEEIIFSDRTHDKIVIMSAAGAVLHTINVDFDYGDNLEIANVAGDGMNEIIIADRDNHIRAYSVAGGNNPILTTYMDVEQYDGLVTRDVNGTEIDDIFHFDRADRIRKVDINYPANAINLFEDSLAGTDLVWFFGHGNPNGIAPAVVESNFPVNFGGSHPIINAWSCSTGDYEGNSDNGIAEAFLQSGAGIYVGSTEVSPNTKNSNAGRKLYRDYWEPEGDHKIAESFLWFKNDRWEVSEYYDFWWYFINEYNLYGDPKFDILAPTIAALDTAYSPSAIQPLATTQNLTIHLPMYTVETVEGIDYVEIPKDTGLGTHSGDLYQDYGQYEVPLYIHTVQIPAGQQVQDVILTSRDDKTAQYGLNLPLADTTQSSTGLVSHRIARNQQIVSALPGHDWSPNFSTPYNWSVYDNIDGGSTLTITLIPFYYDPVALYSEYYQDFVFAIQIENSAVQILNAATDQAAYSAGDSLQLSLEVFNGADTHLDAVVSTFIRKGGSGEVVDGFELTALDDLSGTGSLELTWGWTDPTLLPGSYTIEVIIEDMEKNRLAQRSLDLTLGQAAGEVTEFMASPVLFQPGQTVTATMEFTNTGDLPLSGQAVIQVQTLDGEIVDEFTQSFSALSSTAAVTAQMNWDSTAAPDFAYRLVGYVNYASQSTQAVSRTIGIVTRVYLPLLRR